MAAKSTTPIAIAVSACLLGQAVRYDGRDKRHAGVLFLFASGEFLPVPICPEVAAGLGVPRPAVEPILANGEIRLLGVEHRQLDVTARLTCQAERLAARMPKIAGMICKSKSPSCGLQVVLRSRKGEPLGQVEGLFIRILRRRLPDLPIIDEIALEDPETRQQFLAQVRAFVPR